MNFEPYAERVVVRVDVEVATKDQFGMAIPSSAVEVPQTGEVLAVGPDCKHAKVGHTVYFSRHGGRKVKIAGEEVLILHESEVLGRHIR